MDINAAAMIGAAGLALYAGHHVGDYWVQTDWMARAKGGPGHWGRWACLLHVVTYVLTQAACLGLLGWVIGGIPLVGGLVALLVSGVTHYMADRREYSFMFWVAWKLGKGGFMKLGVPRAGVRIVRATGFDLNGKPFSENTETVGDNPCLGTGAGALDQSWHIVLGVFISALIVGLFA